MKSMIGGRRTLSARILLHVGLAKTGTTSLQELLFEAHPEIRYFGQSNFRYDPEAWIVLRALQFGGVNDRAAAKKILTDAAQKGSAIVISDEALTLGEFVHRATRWAGHSTTARWARALLGEAHVLIVLRNQADWLEAWHRQGLKTGKYFEADYRAWLRRELGLSDEQLLTLLDYEMLYLAYRHEFGSRRVHVRFYEDYWNRFEDLAAECASFIDIDADRARRLIRDGQPRNITRTGFRGYPPLVRRFATKARARRIFDKLPAGLRIWLREVLARERTYRRLNEADRAAIRDRFAASNARLLQALGLKDNLSTYQAASQAERPPSSPAAVGRSRP